MSSKKTNKKPVWLNDDIWDDTPDIDSADKLKETEYWKQLKPTLDEINRKARKRRRKTN